MPNRVLLIDDDPKIVPLLQRGLAYEGFEVFTAVDGQSGIHIAQLCQPHLVLLDIMMPDVDGFEVCRRIRMHNDPAIIMLTARDETSDKVRALTIGADDYIAKPFVFDELVARMRAVLRRHHDEGNALVFDDLMLNLHTREATRQGMAIELTAKEFELLLLLMRHPRQILTREQLLDQIWGYDSDIQTNVVEVHIGHLRQKLEAQGGTRLIQTIRGAGYALRLEK
jgi:two-component system, OmpR family, response regulator MprA